MFATTYQPVLNEDMHSPSPFPILPHTRASNAPQFRTLAVTSLNLVVCSAQSKPVVAFLTIKLGKVLTPTLFSFNWTYDAQIFLKSPLRVEKNLSKIVLYVVL